MLTSHLLTILEVLVFSGVGWCFFVVITPKLTLKKRKKQKRIWLFLTYLVGVILLTLFPLPQGPDDFLTLEEPHYILQPFYFIRRIASHYQGHPKGELFNFLKEDVVTQPFMNFLLFMPFGYFLKKWTRLSTLKIIFLAFSFSLLIEITQLTSFFGGFSHPYRLFEVDDLIMNTLGGIGGTLFVRKKCLSNPTDSAILKKYFTKKKRRRN